MPRNKTTRVEVAPAASPHIRLADPHRYQRALAEVRRLLTETEEAHHSLLGYARTHLPEAESDPFFLYVIRRHWLERFGELSDSWQTDLPQAYKDIRGQLEVSTSDFPSWITTSLLARTLSLYQPFYSMPLTPKTAASIILNASRLLDAGGIK